MKIAVYHTSSSSPNHQGCAAHGSNEHKALDAALAKDGDAILTEPERSAIQDQRAELMQVKEGSHDPEQIKASIKRLEKVCEGYVARRMNSSVQSMMIGHEVEEFNA